MVLQNRIEFDKGPNSPYNQQVRDDAAKLYERLAEEAGEDVCAHDTRWLDGYFPYMVKIFGGSYAQYILPPIEL